MLQIFHSSEATSILQVIKLSKKQQIKSVGAEAPSVHIICGLVVLLWVRFSLVLGLHVLPIHVV